MEDRQLGRVRRGGRGRGRDEARGAVRGRPPAAQPNLLRREARPARRTQPLLRGRGRRGRDQSGEEVLILAPARPQHTSDKSALISPNTFTLGREGEQIEQINKHQIIQIFEMSVAREGKCDCCHYTIIAARQHHLTGFKYQYKLELQTNLRED